MSRKKYIKKENNNFWITFSDMSTLLLVFFVILLTIGETKKVKQMIILSTFEGRLGLLQGGQSFSPRQFETMGASIESLTSFKNARKLSESIKEAKFILDAEIKSKKIRVTEDERGIVISLMSDIFFEPGDYKVRIKDVVEILENIRAVIDNRGFKNKIHIEGFTDSVDFGNEEIKDNWDLSAKRAWAVLKALEAIPSLTKFDEEKVSIHGYGSSRPLESNETPEGRAANRRVDIVLFN